MYFEKHNATFIHIPKTGGTAITRSLLGLEHSPMPLSNEELSLVGSGRGKNIRSRHPKVSEMSIKDGSVIFTVVRDPIQRWISAYNFRCRRLGFYGFDKIVDKPVEGLKILRYEDLEKEFNELFPEVTLGVSNSKSRIPNKREIPKDAKLPQKIIDRILKRNPYEAELYGY